MPALHSKVMLPSYPESKSVHATASVEPEDNSELGKMAPATLPIWARAPKLAGQGASTETAADACASATATTSTTGGAAVSASGTASSSMPSSCSAGAASSVTSTVPPAAADRDVEVRMTWRVFETWFSSATSASNESAPFELESPPEADAAISPLGNMDMSSSRAAAESLRAVFTQTRCMQLSSSFPTSISPLTLPSLRSRLAATTLIRSGGIPSNIARFV